jgi:predicted PurR-regulated permease PerM
MMAALFGFLGLLLAVPILATAKILIEELYVESIADEH